MEQTARNIRRHMSGQHLGACCMDKFLKLSCPIMWATHLSKILVTETKVWSQRLVPTNSHWFNYACFLVWTVDGKVSCDHSTVKTASKDLSQRLGELSPISLSIFSFSSPRIHRPSVLRPSLSGETDRNLVEVVTRRIFLVLVPLYLAQCMGEASLVCI